MKDIDKVILENISKSAVPPSDSVWSQIENSLNVNVKRKNKYIGLLKIAASLIVISIASSIILLDHSSNQADKVDFQEMKLESIEDLSITINESQRYSNIIEYNKKYKIKLKNKSIITNLN